MFVLERLGTPAIEPADEEWAEALTAAAVGAGFGSLGVFLSSPVDVRRVR
ncbi:hypothetical protein ACR9E3_01945 [Actinomycetospora sp. C-140]